MYDKYLFNPFTFWSMKEILERHNLHSKNLGKLEQPSLELQVSYFCCPKKKIKIECCLGETLGAIQLWKNIFQILVEKKTLIIFKWEKFSNKNRGLCFSVFNFIWTDKNIFRMYSTIFFTKGCFLCVFKIENMSFKSNQNQY